MTSAQPRVLVLFPDAVGAAGEVCVDNSRRGWRDGWALGGDRSSSECSRMAVAGGWFARYIGRVLIQLWRGGIHHPGGAGARAGFGKISSLNKSPGSRPPAHPGSQTLSLFASFIQRQ